MRKTDKKVGETESMKKKEGIQEEYRMRRRINIICGSSRAAHS